MLDTVGPELLIVNKSEKPISLEEDSLVILTPDQDREATSDLLPINYSGLSKVKDSQSCVYRVSFGRSVEIKFNSYENLFFQLCRQSRRETIFSLANTCSLEAKQLQFGWRYGKLYEV